MSSSEASRIWWEVHLSLGADVGSAEVAAAILREEAAGGLAEAADGWLAYLPDQDTAHALATRLATVTGLECSVHAVADEDWSAWRYAFKPRDIGDRLRIVPVYDPADHHPARRQDPAGSERLPVYIEPGLAFGTGEHPTTANCLGFLADVLQPGQRVLDVGTGSGILALAAAVLGASEVLGIDIDPVACRSAGANLALNPLAAGRVRFVCADATWLGAPGGPDAIDPGPGQRQPLFDVVLANLTTDLAAQLLPELRRQTSVGGWLVLSGISEERAAELAPALATGEVTVERSIAEHGWLTLLCRAVPPA